MSAATTLIQLEPVAPAAPAPVAAAPAPLEFPCTLAQERFWVLDRLDPGNPALNIAVRWQIDGKLDADTLERAFQSVLARHEILRTSIVERDGTPMQRVQPECRFRLPAVDLSIRPEADQPAELVRLGLAEASAPFDLTSAPLIRALLVRLSAERAILHVTVHHLVADGWSIGVLAREVGAYCHAIAQGQDAGLEELPVQYGDFALWQQNWLQTDALHQQTEYWPAKLAGMKQFELPTDRPRPPVQTANGSIVSVLLPRQLTGRLQELSRAAGATLFATALAALKVLLHRHTGETDIGIGTQVAGRDQEDLEGLVGVFINTLVLRDELGGDPTFRTLLGRVRQTVLDALAYADMPIQKLMEILKPERDLSRNPLFSINFIFQRSFIQNTDYGQFRLTDMASLSPGAIYDLNFFMVERPDGWRASCEFNTDLFDAPTVIGLLDQFQILLAAITENPDRRLSDYNLFSEAERRRHVVEWNATEAEYPHDLTVPELIGRQASRTPDSVALICGDTRLDFRTFEEAANRLAHRLRREGVGPGVLVGVHLSRSADMVLAMVATMKAGGAYVPLDPTYPAGRLVHVIQDSGLRVLLSRSDLRGRLPESGARTLLLDKVSGALLEEPSSPPVPSHTPGDLAYVIYTSGSTGLPKGVQIRHGALVNLLWAMRDRPGLSAADTLIAVTTLSFDIAALELLLPLVTGARLVVADEAAASDGPALLDLLRRHAATVMQATPVTWRALLAAGWVGQPRLKMLCGGEALPRRLAEDLLQCGGELWNMYGPTETTIWSSTARVQSGHGPVPIGGPIANTQFHVLDGRRELTPAGAIGELYIGGDGVAAGYVNRPELTAERFVPDPFARYEDARMYRTGDLVRRRHDGTIEFIGRVDHQVKLRGLRIELGEIEAALLRHPAVAEAVCVVREDARRGAFLAAYVAPHDASFDPEAGIRELHATAADMLPGYMRPTMITLLEALPRTPNGKIDRRALPDPVMPRSEQTAAFADATEQQVARIWGEILGTTPPGPLANFFEMGGHSLLAMRMLARLEAAFGTKIPLARLFQTPTIRELSGLLAAPPVLDEFAVVRVQPKGEKTAIFAINNTGIFYNLSRRLGMDQPLTAVQLFDPETPQAGIGGSLEDIAAGYLRIIRQVQPHGPYILLGLCASGCLAWEVGRQLRGLGEEVRLVAILDAWAPGYLRRLTRLKRTLAELTFRASIFSAEARQAGSFSGNVGYLLRRLGEKLRLVAPRPLYADSPWYQVHLEAAVRNYNPEPCDQRVLLIQRRDQPSGRWLDPHYGWADLVGSKLSIAHVQGGHLGLLQDPSVQLVAEHIARELAGDCDVPGRS